MALQEWTPSDWKAYAAHCDEIAKRLRGYGKMQEDKGAESVTLNSTQLRDAVDFALARTIELGGMVEAALLRIQNQKQAGARSADAAYARKRAEKKRG